MFDSKQLRVLQHRHPMLCLDLQDHLMHLEVAYVLLFNKKIENGNILYIMLMYIYIHNIYLNIKNIFYNTFLCTYHFPKHYFS